MDATRLIFFMVSSTLVVLVRCTEYVTLDAAAPPPDYATECKAQQQELVPCLDAVTGNGSPPSKECCAGIIDIVNNKPICLCYIVATGAKIFNVTLALQLPMLCNVAADPHQCDGFPGFNFTVPPMAPMPMPPMSMPPMPDAPPPVAGGPNNNAATSTTEASFLLVSAAMAILALINLTK